MVLVEFGAILAVVDLVDEEIHTLRICHGYYHLFAAPLLAEAAWETLLVTSCLTSRSRRRTSLTGFRSGLVHPSNISSYLGV